ncbi:hypothetical protein BXT92_11015 [Klebsiella pneumoniae]|nr:hypothetical protein BXT92_11015 [Klebsiella pneumoniae]
MSTFPASLLILNGKGANEPQLREAVNLLRDEGIDIHVRVTWEKGDAARFIDEALQLNVEKLKAALGGVSYLIHGLMRMDTLKPDRCEIRGENFHWQGDALVIGIGNGRQAGGGQQLCPEALINDGLLHLRIFTGEELIPALFSTLANPENSPNIVDGVSSWFEITAPHEMTFNLDGEPLSGKTFRMELLPAALRCRLPPDCPLLR